MRIVSKYKDFYDFLAQDNDADITYVRKPFLYKENLDRLYCPDHNSWYSSKNIPQSTYWYYRKKKEGDIDIENYIFGIYPYVYSQPYLEVAYIQKATANLSSNRITMSRDWCEEYISLKDDKDKAEMEIDLAKRLTKNLSNDDDDLFRVPKSYNPTSKTTISRYLWKEECPEIFMKIGAPTFVKYDDAVVEPTYGFEPRQQMDVVGNGKNLQYIANICFNKLSGGILKCWFDELNDLNTYINIENFLWASKQEPEHVPDNNTKIINHGFDLKTSFRKM